MTDSFHLAMFLRSIHVVACVSTSSLLLCGNFFVVYSFTRIIILLKGQTAGSCNNADKYKRDRLYIDPKKLDTSVG